MVIPGVEKKIGLPGLKTGKMLQKRKENPGQVEGQTQLRRKES